MTIKELRMITGLSQKAFGEKYHIPKRSIENWEGGQRAASDTILYLLTRVVREDYMSGLENRLDYDKDGRFEIFWVAGERDGQILYKTDNEAEATNVARDLCKLFEEDFDPQWGGISIWDNEKQDDVIDW